MSRVSSLVDGVGEARNRCHHHSVTLTANPSAKASFLGVDSIKDPRCPRQLESNPRSLVLDKIEFVTSEISSLLNPIAPLPYLAPEFNLSLHDVSLSPIYKTALRHVLGLKNSNIIPV